MSGPVLVTGRLELWRPVASDHADLFAMMQSEVTRRFLGSWEPTPADMHARLLRNAGSWSLYGYGTFMVRERGQERIVGNCGVFHSWRGLGEDFDDQPEAGWILAEDSAGKGYAREAMEITLEWYDRTYGPRPMVCMIDPANTRSLDLAAHLGFEFLRNGGFGGESVRLFRRDVTASTRR